MLDLLRSLSCLLAEGEGPARWTGPDCFEIRIRTRRERFVFLRAADGSIPYVRYHQRVLQRVAP